MSTESKPSIAAKSQDARQKLADLTSHLEGHVQNNEDRKPPVEPSATMDALERFTLWAGNMGAMRSPASRLSLDQRLSKAPEIHELVCQLLKDLIEVVEDLSSIAKGNGENRETAFDIDIDSEGNAQLVPSNNEDTIQKLSDEASMLLILISNCITSLLRTETLIRKVGSTDRFARALQMSTATFHPEFDIDYVREKHPKLKTTRGLPERLSNAMSKRRQFIKYSRDYRARLGYEEPMAGAFPARTEQLYSKTTSLGLERLPGPPHLPTAFQVEDEKKEEEEDEKEEEEEEEEEDLVLTMSASMSSHSACTLKLPTLEDLSPNGASFECPICFTPQSFRREEAWRIHAFRDLKAYVCTVGGKDCESKLFGDRNSWFEHELRCHRSQYTCVLCTAEPFAVKSDVESHISTAHGSFTAEQLQKLEDAGKQAPTLFRAQDCPFCNDWAEKVQEVADPEGRRSPPLVSATCFKRHVAVHQEQLASYTVPRAVEKNNTPGSGSVGATTTVRLHNSMLGEEAFDSTPQSSDSRHELHNVDSDKNSDLDPAWAGFGYYDGFYDFEVPGRDPEDALNPAPLGGPYHEAQARALEENLPADLLNKKKYVSGASVFPRSESSFGDPDPASRSVAYSTRSSNMGRASEEFTRARKAGVSVTEGSTTKTRNEGFTKPPLYGPFLEPEEYEGLYADSKFLDGLFK